MSTANNVTRLLKARRIQFQVFELPAVKLGARDTASLLGVPPGIIFKTIVVTRDGIGKPLLVLVPGSAVVDARLVAAAVGAKKVHVTTEREAEAITGLQAGGISPLALIHRGFQVLVDASARESEHIHVSGGERGLNIKLRTKDLVALTGALLAPASKPDGLG
jgi:Cys-tRNA(Pro)/Cys-tRNA(Cys) deacylase